MSPKSNANATMPQTRRAKQACKVCHSRRVRCNVLQMKPCHNCVAADIACEVLPSRRGKYQRKRRQLPSPPDVQFSPNSIPQLANTPESETSSRIGAAEDMMANVMDPYGVRRHHSIASQANTPSAQTSETQATGSQAEEIHPVGIQAIETQGASTPTTTPRSVTTRNAANRAIEARAIEGEVDEMGSGGTQTIDRTLFFGESNFLTCVAGERFNLPQPSRMSAQPNNRLCYPISDAINTKGSARSAPWTIPQSSLRYDYLQNEGAFTYPNLEDYLEVLRAYFRWFHPCFPILDRNETARMVKAGDISPLLFQAILFIGTSYCDEETVHRMGFRDRPEAKAQLYHRARLLYDADWESNKVTVLQTLFLISFWRAGPLNEKNTRYWLGAAISLAQTRGFHRAVETSTRYAKEAKMRRRIWWSIYVRDRQSSASLGLPSRIRDEDCDVEMLSPSDLEDEAVEATADFFGIGEPGYIGYAMEMARLAKLLGKIITNQFTPGESHLDKDERSSLSEALIKWKSELPENMQECGSENGPGMIWTYQLHLAYHNLHILLHRRAYVRPQNESDTQAGEVALRAACRITRLVEDMLSHDLIRFGQLHVITSLFSSLCIHSISLQRSKDTARRLAEHRAQMCLLGLKEIQKYWEVNNLVLELFFQYLDESTAKRLRASDLEPMSDGAMASNTTVQLESVQQQPVEHISSITDMNMVSSSHASLQANSEPPLGAGPPFSPGQLFFNTPQSILYQNSTADPYALFMDSQAPINDGLDMQGLQFLQRCL